jgi:ketosteroid isomerase-like protein
MSQENVETVRRAIAAINARNIDAYLACCAENVELLIAESVGAEYLGADGIRRFFTDIEDALTFRSRFSACKQLATATRSPFYGSARLVVPAGS